MSDRQERTQPGDVIGYRADGRPIHLLAGGSGEDEDQQAQPDDQSGADGGESTDDQGTGDDGKTFDATYVKQLRDEAAKHRNEKNQTTEERDKLKTTIDQLRKALDPDSDDGEDPAKVAERATQERDQKVQELREKTVELAVHRKASKAGADADALLDSRAFLRAAADLDPAGKDFDGELDSAIKSAVENNSKLRAGQAPSRSGGEFTGGTGGKPTFTSDQVKAMSAEEYDKNRDAIHAAMADGRYK